MWRPPALSSRDTDGNSRRPGGGRRRHLEPIDEAGVVADYEAGATLAAIQQRYDIGLTRLYRILDHHQVPRRRPTAPRLGNRVRQRVLADYRAGMHDRRHRPQARHLGGVGRQHRAGRRLAPSIRR